MPITPGQCEVSASGIPQCPPPTEIDCVEVLKVYDQCFAEDVTVTQFEIPDKTISHCEVDFSTNNEGVPYTRCEIASVSEPDAQDFRTIIARQIVRIRVFFTDGTNVTHDVPAFFSDAFLYSPEGTFAQCELVSARCDCTRMNGNTTPQAMCTIRVCKIIEVKALVKLLIPTYGFCVPEPCIPSPQPGFPCPPDQLFPPQRVRTTDNFDLNVDVNED